MNRRSTKRLSFIGIKIDGQDVCVAFRMGSIVATTLRNVVNTEMQATIHSATTVHLLPVRLLLE